MIAALCEEFFSILFFYYKVSSLSLTDLYW